jgi:hypothetical protein
MNQKFNGWDVEQPYNIDELQAQLRSAMMIVGILVQKLGGKVEITFQELQAIYDYTLIRTDMPDEPVMGFAVRLTPGKGEGS